MNKPHRNYFHLCTRGKSPIMEKLVTSIWTNRSCWERGWWKFWWTSESLLLIRKGSLLPAFGWRSHLRTTSDHLYVSFWQGDKGRDVHSLIAMRKTRAVTESKMLSHLRLLVSFGLISDSDQKLTARIADLQHQTTCTSILLSWNESRYPSAHYWWGYKLSSRDTSSLDSGSQYVLVGRHVIRIRDPGNSVKVAATSAYAPQIGNTSLLRSRIVQLQLIPPVESLPDALIGPELLDCLGEFWGHLITLNLDWGGHDDIPSWLVVGTNGYFHERNSFE